MVVDAIKRFHNNGEEVTDKVKQEAFDRAQVFLTQSYLSVGVNTAGKGHVRLTNPQMFAFIRTYLNGVLELINKE